MNPILCLFTAVLVVAPLWFFVFWPLIFTENQIWFVIGQCFAGLILAYHSIIGLFDWLEERERKPKAKKWT
jgi:hypothetical protein